MASEGILNHQQLIRGLVKLCRDKVSGTVFFNLDDGRSARLVLHQGAISWVAFQELRGEAAIDAISEIDAARLNFNPVLKLAIGNQNLPSTPEVLKQLNSYVGSISEPPVPMVTEVVSPTPQAAADVEGDGPFLRDRVCLVLERESIEYLGPMAKLLCEEHMRTLPNQLTLVQVRQAINALSNDIQDGQKSRLFQERVAQELGIH